MPADPTAARQGIAEIEAAREALGGVAAETLRAAAGRRRSLDAVALRHSLAPLALAVWVVVDPAAWRPALAAIALVAAATARARRRAGPPDAAAVRASVNERAGLELDVAEDSPGTLDGLPRALSPGVRLALVGQLWAGALLGAVLAHGGPTLERDLDLGPATAAWVVAAALAAGGGVALAAPLRPGPTPVVVAAGLAVAMIVAGQGWAVPTTWAGLALASGGAVSIHADLLGRSLVGAPAAVRSHVASASTAAVTVGALLGVVVDALVERRFGPGAALVCAAPALVLAARWLVRAAPILDDEVGAVAAELVEDQQIRVLEARGIAPPLLSCRHIDFGYDGLQVLYDVSIDVDQGEMVALLGTNGAGKSTLLRAVSGLGRPMRGSVRLDGEDITTMSPERRVRRGIVQVPGGRATFRRLTVEENLLAYAYTLGVDRRRAVAQLTPVFDRFPRLAERRGKPASTLSGGEAQMLGLAKAILLEPRLLIIDELSLGLAPKIVGELLELVRAINAGGTAVVLVEQSLNVALSLVDRAYFMEKGRVRFEGTAAGLLERDDLLRSVFLAGAEDAR